MTSSSVDVSFNFSFIACRAALYAALDRAVLAQLPGRRGQADSVAGNVLLVGVAVAHSGRALIAVPRTPGVQLAHNGRCVLAVAIQCIPILIHALDRNPPVKRLAGRERMGHESRNQVGQVSAERRQTR